jgi:hypothetical protein
MTSTSDTLASIFTALQTFSTLAQDGGGGDHNRQFVDTGIIVCTHISFQPFGLDYGFHLSMGTDRGTSLVQLLVRPPSLTSFLFSGHGNVAITCVVLFLAPPHSYQALLTRSLLTREAPVIPIYLSDAFLRLS